MILLQVMNTIRFLYVDTCKIDIVINIQSRKLVEILSIQVLNV